MIIFNMRKEMRKVGKYAQKMIIHFVDILSNKYFAKTWKVLKKMQYRCKIFVNCYRMERIIISRTSRCV